LSALSYDQIYHKQIYAQSEGSLGGFMAAIHCHTNEGKRFDNFVGDTHKVMMPVWPELTQW
jgi:hypothetical protein